MEFSFTKKQVEFMIYSLYLSSWVSYRDNDSGPFTKEFEALGQYFLGFAYNMKWFDWIDYDRSTSTYIIKPAREDELLSSIIDTYNEETFWEELKSRLAERDLQQALPASDLAKKSAVELFKLRLSKETKYENEFREKGLERFDIKD
jgi:hypothetical protein